jgi:pimeloyl-ACP methyl ester carboxylesterase
VLRERLVRVSDDPTVELFVAEVGEPGHRPLLVIHGGPDWDHTYLREPLVRLRNDRRVVFVDLRGCGRSTRGLSAGAYTPDAAMRDVVVLLDEIADQPVDVLGFSYGGMLVQRLALMVPERVRRIVIASSSVLPVPPDAFDGWLDRVQRLAAQPRVESCDGDAPDVDHTRLDAYSSANANVWQLELLPEYLARLDQVHFSADWTASWLADDLPAARPEAAAERLAALGKPILAGAVAGRDPRLPDRLCGLAPVHSHLVLPLLGRDFTCLQLMREVADMFVRRELRCVARPELPRDTDDPGQGW